MSIAEPAPESPAGSPGQPAPAPCLGLPAPLRPGDAVALAAASSALDDSTRLEAGLAVLRGWGLRTPAEPGALVGRRWGYMAGQDRARRNDLESCSAPLLACVRGGWGSARLLEQPLSLPEGWLLGFSDVTSLLWARLARGQRGGVHGPLLTTLAAEPAWSQERLRQLLFGEPLADLEGEAWVGGRVEGPLLAANLTVATHLLGSPHMPPLDGAILVLEDVGEAPYRIERMLTHWRLCGALQRLGGIGFGSFRDCVDGDRQGDPPDRFFSLEQVLRERTADLGVPVLAGLPVGHTAGNAALPLGVRARLDADQGRLSLPG